MPIFRQASLPLHTTTVHGGLHSRTEPKAPQCYHHAGLRMGSQCADSWLSRQFHPMGPLYTPPTPLRSMLPCAKEAATAWSKLLPGTECGSCQLGLLCTTPCPVSPGIRALCLLQPWFSHLSSQQTQGSLSSGDSMWLPRSSGRRASEATL